MQGAAKLDWNIYRTTPWMNLQNSNLPTGCVSYSICTVVLSRGPGREGVFLHGVDTDNFVFYLQKDVINFFSH